VQYKVLNDVEAGGYELNTNLLVNSPDDVIGPGCGHLLRPVCSLTSDPGYIIYSACGSFWVPMLGMVGFYWKIYKTAVAATEAYKRGFVEQKTEGLSSSTSDNALCKLRIHRGGSSNSVLQRHSNGCLSELLPRPSAEVIQASRRSIAQQTANRSTSIRRGAVVAAPDVMARPIPKIVITKTASCAEDDLRKERDKQTTVSDCKTSDKNKTTSLDSRRRKKKNSKQQKSQLKTTSDSEAAGTSGTAQTQSEDGAEPKKEKRKSSFLGLFDGDGGGDRRLSLQIAARFAKLHIISQLRSLNREKKAAKTVGIIVGCFT